ncbi:hypothetical protein ACEWY4_027237 [Coilia grayii]|uniref:ETS domain-containing protein n=1 Tax=Coilia grayii TaxID=363190 RepID=A0ABD1IVX9_9TELE
MTSVVVVDGGGAVLEYVSDAEVVSQDVVLEADAGMCEIKKEVKEEEEETQEEELPAVVVEQVPCAELEQCYAAQVVVYDDETYLMQGVAEEQEVETEVLEVGTVEASSHGGGVEYVALDKTIEAAEALLHMDSPSSLREDRSPVPDMLGEMEVEVEVSTENTEPIDPLDEQLTLEGDAQKAKKGRKRKATPQVEREDSPDLTFKKKPRVGKNSTYLWEFLLDLLQDRNTCPKYIKWTQREKGIFKLVDSKAVSRLWGKYKNKPDMNYETMGRALRYYYQRGILSKVEGQRLVYQFNDMPKNIVFIDDDKSDAPSTPPTPCERVTPVTPTSPRGRPLAAQVKVQAPTAATAPAKTTQMLRIVNVSGGSEAFVTLQPQGASPVTTVTAPRTDRVALQVPLVMTTSLGQKISTVTAVNQPSSPLFTTAALPSAQVSSSSGQKVLIQSLPTMVPATGENGQKFTVQLAKLFTIPASQLAQCTAGTVLTQQPKVTAGGSARGISLMGTPLTLRTIAPVTVPTTAVAAAPHGTTQVLRLVAQQPSVTTVSTVPSPVPAAAPVSVPVSVPTATVVVTSTESANVTPLVPATSEKDVTIIKVESEDDPSTQVITDAVTPSDS